MYFIWALITHDGIQMAYNSMTSSVIIKIQTRAYNDKFFETDQQ